MKRGTFKGLLTAGVLTASVFTSSSALAAVDMFLRVGNIVGEFAGQVPQYADLIRRTRAAAAQDQR